MLSGAVAEASARAVEASSVAGRTGAALDGVGAEGSPGLAAGPVPVEPVLDHDRILELSHRPSQTLENGFSHESTQRCSDTTLAS
jgi:hypothetical protein